MSNDALSTVRMPAFKPRAVASSTEPTRTLTTEQHSGEATQKMNVEAVKASAKQIESYLKKSGRELEFHVDEQSGQMVVSVRDSETGDLIRQIPGEEVLRMARALEKSDPSLINIVV